QLSFDYRRIGGSLRGGGEVGVVPGAAESALASGSGIILLTRDYRRARTDMVPNGWVDETERLSDFTSLTAWGDSMTTDQGALGTSLAVELARELGVTAHDRGVSSDTPYEVAWRFGGLSVSVVFPSSIGVLPASGSVPVTVTPSIGWAIRSRTYPCVIHDVDGKPVLITLTHSETGTSTDDAPTWTVMQRAVDQARSICTGTRRVHA